MAELVVTSPANPRLKALVALRRRRAREAAGVSIVEGHEELTLALAAGVVPTTCYYCPELFGPPGPAGTQELADPRDTVATLRASRVETVRLSPAAFAKISYREGPDGMLAVVPAPTRALADLPLPSAGAALVTVCQGVEKPGNLGAIVRTAEAAGSGAVISADPVTDWANPNVVRASKGAVFAVPVAAATTADTIAWCRQRGVSLVVTTPVARRWHTEVDLTGPVAIVVGSEKHGVDPVLREAADELVRIPMAGRVNSLNVSVAAAVVLFEAVRQRATGERAGGGQAPGDGVVKSTP